MSGVSKKSKYTIADIAREIGVSKTTVSRALNDKADILPETKQRILDLIKKHNYHPNAFAKAMSSSKNYTIGVVIPHDIDYVFMNPYYEEIIRGIFKEADSRGYYILLIYCHNDNYLEMIYQKRIDGLIVVSPGLNHKQIIDNIKSTGIPYLLTSKMPKDPLAPHVCVNNRDGARRAVGHLLELGHRRIAFINGPNILASSEDRLLGYQDALLSAGRAFDESLVFSGGNSIESGYDVMQAALASVEPTAVFLASDLMAFGAMNAIQSAGLGIPEDISVVGFDDIALARVMNPPLTTIKQFILEEGFQAVRLLISSINGNDIPAETMLEVELVVRKTTGPLL